MARETGGSVEDMDEITGGEAARLLAVTRQHISRLAHDGKLPGRQLAGRYWIFKRSDVEAYKVANKPKGGRPQKPIARRVTRLLQDMGNRNGTD